MPPIRLCFHKESMLQMASLYLVTCMSWTKNPKWTVGVHNHWGNAKESIELQAFVDERILTRAEVDEVIVSSFNPVRVKFEGIAEIVTEDILNCGVSPKRLLEILKTRFLHSGGCEHLLLRHAFKSFLYLV